MLRVEFDDDGNGTVMVRLQGRLVGLYAEDAMGTLAQHKAPATVLVDLSEVTFVDPLGEQVLLWLGRLGAKFVAVNMYTREVCTRLQLQVAEQPAASDPGPDTQVPA